MNANVVLTTADKIGRFIQIRDHIAHMTEKFEESLAPYKEAMTALEGSVTEDILAAGGQSIKTDSGTAYRSTTLAVRCADREAFLDFVFDGRREGFLTSAVSKEAVKEYLDTHNNQPPPGVDCTFVTKTNFRKA